MHNAFCTAELILLVSGVSGAWTRHSSLLGQHTMRLLRNAKKSKFSVIVSTCSTMFLNDVYIRLECFDLCKWLHNNKQSRRQTAIIVAWEGTHCLLLKPLDLEYKASLHATLCCRWIPKNKARAAGLSWAIIAVRARWTARYPKFTPSVLERDICEGLQKRNWKRKYTFRFFPPWCKNRKK